MRKALLLGALFLSLVLPAWSQVETATLRVRVILLDGELNQKPAARLMLTVIRADGVNAKTVTVKTSFEGTAEVQVPPGRYRVSTPEGVEFQGKKYAWSADVTVSAPESSLDLSNDNATVAQLGSGEEAGRGDDLAALFKKYQNSVVTVWSESGHGTGFVVDEAGLILTNQHVIGTSEYVAVQFDERRKVAAKVVAFDAERDIAVLWADLDAFPESIVAPLAKSPRGKAAVAEGDRVFTIGSPLNQQKIMASGIVSKIEPRVILSDIRINHGNSGGPLFSLAGTVVGLTTFLDRDTLGSGVAGIVRIEEAEPLLERARAKMRDMTAPEAKLLAVEPGGAYPLVALKSSLEARKFDESPYIFRQGDYDVAIVTPILKYRLAEGSHLHAQQEKEKRTTRTTRAVQGTFRPLDDLKDWAEYTGEYKPVIQIEARPQLGRVRGLKLDFKNLGRENPPPRRMKFKADFYRMKLFCGAREIEPIHPGKVATELDYHTQSYEIADATFAGIYSYPYDAISSSCSAVTLQLFSESEPEKPVSRVLDPKTIARVTADFEPYRKGQIELSTEADPSK